ncbi:MAG: hypothetical protein HYV40_04860 [Candidatus Levybacteria bacterium]|nr:hypothetical protein [Candidatus Levybacteria bacterium]
MDEKPAPPTSPIHQSPMTQVENAQAVSPQPHAGSPMPVIPPKTMHHFPLSRIILIALVIMTIIFASVYAATFYFLNQQLDKLTRVNRTQISPTPQTTPTPKPNPTATWKTYTNDALGISFEHPSDWEVSINKENNTFLGIGPTNDLPKIYARSFLGDTDQYIKVNYIPEQAKATSKKPFTDSVYNATEYFVDYNESLPGFGPGERTIVALESPKKNKFLFDSYGRPHESFGQIVSTFRFLDAITTPTCTPRPACLDSEPRCMIPETPDMCPKATPTTSANQTVCTQDAKQCPDGSWVGRTGPNCEFASCPE